MIIKGYTLDTTRPRLSLLTPFGGSVEYWGFGEDALVTFCVKKEDHAASKNLKAELIEAGFKGAKPMTDEVERRVRTIISKK